MAEDFFSNRELYDLIQQTANEMVNLKMDLQETRTVIRDYNKLRKKLMDIEEKTHKVNMKLNTLMWVITISIPALGLLFTFLNYLGR